MRQHLRILFALVVLAGLPSLVRAQSPPDGAALYASSCGGCHGALASSGISQGGRNLTSIKNANMTMGLTDAQLQAIVGALTGLKVTTASLSAAQVGSSYSATLAGTGGTSPYTWSPFGTLPAWMSLSSGGVLSGTPTASGAASIVVQLTDSLGRTAFATFSLTINAAPQLPTLNVSPLSLSFSYQIGGSAPAAQSVSVSSSGTALSYTAAASGASWLSASPANGTTPGSVSVSVNPSGLAAGSYNASVTIAAAGAASGTSPKTVAVTLNVTPAALPNLNASPSSLSFSYQIGGNVPAAQSVSVTSSGSALSYAAAGSGAAWLSVSPASGTTPSSVSVSVNPSGLAAGTYNASVSIASAGAATGTSPRTIGVTLNVAAAALPTLSASPMSLSFTYQMGGSAPGAQSVSVSSSSGALNFTASYSGGTWVNLSSASGTTPGSVGVSVNTAGLAAGNYNGTLTISASGASGSPKTIPISLVVTSAPASPSLTASPAALQFSYQISGNTPAAQTLNVGSSGASIPYMASASTQSGGSWLAAGPASGNTPGSVSVVVSPSGLAAGTYKGSVSLTSSGAPNSPLSVPVTLVVSSVSTNALLGARPTALAFSYSSGEHDSRSSGSRGVRVSSSGAPLNFTASVSGGSWLSISPSQGTTPATVQVSVNTAGMTAGNYSGAVTLSAPGAADVIVSVTMSVVSYGEHEHGSRWNVQPFVSDPTNSGALSAQWVDRAGALGSSGTVPENSALLLSKNSSASTDATAGAVIENVEGTTVTQLGFDIRNGGQCTATSPAFVVVTVDGVSHTIGGCAKGTVQPSPMAGWKRVQFDVSRPDQATPPLIPGMQVKSIALVLSQGPETGSAAAGGIALLDNITVNGVVVRRK